MKTVLIVDDNPNIRGALRAFLRSSTEVKVCGEAADGREAIETAVAKHPDLILMDLLMPQMNGVEAAAVLRKLLPEARIVIFTLYADFVGKSLAAATGIDLVVSKAGGAAMLTEALRPLLAD